MMVPATGSCLWRNIAGPGTRSPWSSRSILRRTTSAGRRKAAVLRSGLVASWINLDLAEVLHRLPPEFVKPFRKAVRELAIPDQQRRKPALSDEGMVQRQHDGLVVDHMERMPELSGVAHARHLSQVMAMHPEEFHQLTRALIREAEHHPMLDPMFRRILGDTPEDREPAFDGGVDGHEITGFHVRQNALPGCREGHQMAPVVSLDTQRQVDEGVAAPHSRLQPRKRRLQLRRLCREPLRPFPRNLDDPGNHYL